MANVKNKDEIAVSSSKKDSTSMILMAGLFVIWYGFNAGYNVYNSKCKDLPMPYMIALCQLLVGAVYIVPLWILNVKSLPRMTISDVVKFLPIVVVNTIGHACSVVAMFEKGGGSFTHVIKASEPVVSVVLGLIINFTTPAPLAFLSLLPVTYGVAYASTLGDLSVHKMSRELTTKAALYAMAGNICYALRSILRKNLSKEFKEKTNLNPSNDHAVTTFLSALLTLPMVVYFEGKDKILTSYEAVEDKSALLVNVFVCGLTYYMYNELQNIVLNSLGAVPTAVGNTLKRVVIFVALFYFTDGETFPIPKIIGCAIAVAGCLLYAIFNSMKL